MNDQRKRSLEDNQWKSSHVACLCFFYSFSSLSLLFFLPPFLTLFVQQVLAKRVSIHRKYKQPQVSLDPLCSQDYYYSLPASTSSFDSFIPCCDVRRFIQIRSHHQLHDFFSFSPPDLVVFSMPSSPHPVSAVISFSLIAI